MSSETPPVNAPESTSAGPASAAEPGDDKAAGDPARQSSADTAVSAARNSVRSALSAAQAAEQAVQDAESAVTDAVAHMNSGDTWCDRQSPASPTVTPSIKPEESATSMAFPTAVNSQIRDSVAQVRQLLKGMQQPFAAAATFNIVAHALSLALQNAVTRHQHSQMPCSALTSAAANAMLEGKLDEANVVMKFAESPLVSPSFDLDVGQLQKVMASLRQELDRLHAAAAA